MKKWWKLFSVTSVSADIAFTVLLASLSILLVTHSSQALAQNYTTECHDFSAPLSGKYCINTPVPLTNKKPNVLYYLHGKGGSTQTWSDQYFYTEQLRQEWAQRKVEPPIVVNVSFGPVWILAKKNESPYSGLYEGFVYKGLPEIEKVIGGVKGRRLILGESMGGFNSLQLSLTTNLFSKVAALCVPMAVISPFASAEEVKQFVERSAAWRYYRSTPNVVTDSVDEMLRLARAFYPTQKVWLTADPLRLIDSLDKDKAPQFYLATGLYDKYVAYEGNEMFAKRLGDIGVDVEWHPQWGGHCAIDIKSLSRFLVGDSSL